MSEELDRRVAIEIMGEEEPKALRPTQDEINRGMGLLTHIAVSPGGNWKAYCIYENGDIPEWNPVSFSSVLEEALRALDKYFAETQLQDSRHEPEMFMEYRPYANAVFCASLDGESGLGQTLPEAICNLLLALKECE